MPETHRRPTNLLADARLAARHGDVVAAERAFSAVLDADPDDVEALSFLGLRAFERGDHARSRALIERALTQRRDPLLLRNLALACLELGDVPAARTAAEAALAGDPRHALAHLVRGRALELGGDAAGAVRAYGRALALEPAYASPRPAAPAVIESLADSARNALHRVLQDAHRAIAERHGPAAARVARAMRIHDRLEQAPWSDPLQRPDFVFVPELPARPWFERREFEWSKRVEAATDSVAAELAAVLEAPGSLDPYVAARLRGHATWGELAGNATWSSYHLLRAGAVVPEAAVRCPNTLALLESLPLPRCGTHAPEAFFSVLRPGAHIPPHTGLSNFKLTVHLPLIVPTGCSIRVGAETRAWTRGELLMFDDSFEHEAWNRGRSARAVLIFDAWRPDLSAAEKQALSESIIAIDAANALRAPEAAA